MMYARSAQVSGTETDPKHYEEGPPVSVSGSARCLAMDYDSIIQVSDGILVEPIGTGEMMTMTSALKASVHHSVLTFGDVS